jgi:hypothetical protein
VLSPFLVCLPLVLTLPLPFPLATAWQPDQQAAAGPAPRARCSGCSGSLARLRARVPLIDEEAERVLTSRPASPPAAHADGLPELRVPLPSALPGRVRTSGGAAALPGADAGLGAAGLRVPGVGAAADRRRRQRHPAGQPHGRGRFRGAAAQRQPPAEGPPWLLRVRRARGRRRAAVRGAGGARVPRPRRPVGPLLPPPVPGHTYLAPLLGLLAYDAADLSAVGLPEQGIVATGAPISVTFRRVREAPPGAPAPRCVHFDLDGGGVPRFSDLARGNACSAYRQGHFSIVVNSSAAPPAPPPPPPGATAGGRGKKGGGSTAWKIAGGVVGAAVALGPLAALTICLVRHRRHRKLETMERNAEDGEAFRMARVGRAQAPVASGTRTQPAIESD